MSKVAQVIQESSLSMADISARSGISVERIEQLVAGESASLNEVRALARGLRLPVRAFSSGAAGRDNQLELLFRDGPENRADLGVEAAGQFVSAALTLLPPRDELPEWMRDFQVPAETYAGAVAMADQFRAAFVGSAVEPLNNLAGILNDLGGVVLGRLDTSRFEGASAVIDGYGFIFVSPRFSGRMLFTLAHELGHLLAHHRQPRSALFEVASQIGNIRHRSKKEAFVDAFASALLMPQEGVAIALREIRRALNVGRDALGDVEILYLAILYGVSFEVAARRCEQLELLPDGGAYSLSDHVKQVYGSAERLAASAGLPARAHIDFPRVSQNLIDAAIGRIDGGEVSIGWVTDRLGCSLSDLYSARAVRGEPRGNRA